MKNYSTAGEGGFIKWIIIIVFALLTLSYFGFNLQEIANRPTTKDNFSYVATTTAQVWNGYLKKPATYIWNQIFLNLIWNPAIEHLKHVETVDLDAGNQQPKI